MVKTYLDAQARRCCAVCHAVKAPGPKSAARPLWWCLTPGCALFKCL